MHRTTFGLFVVLLSLAALVSTATANGGFVPGQTLAEHWTGSKWIQVGSPSPSGGDELKGVDAISSSDVWAVGQHGKRSGSHGLIEHWNGSKWVVLPGPATPGGSWLADVAAIGATDVWAVGGGSGQPVIEHWNGSKWTLAPSPSVAGGELHGVEAIATDDVWAVGDTDEQKTLVEHWDGTSWKVVASPNGPGPGFLAGVAAASPTDVWAVGSTAPKGSPGVALTEHWNGTKWSVVKSSSRAGSSLSAVTVRGTKDVFAAGSYVNSKGCLRTFVLHWGGSSWKQMATPNPFRCDNELLGIAASTKGVEAVGDHPQSCPGSSCKLVTLAIRLAGGGWKLQSSPNSATKYNQLEAMVMVPLKNEGWAVGIATNAFVQ